MNSPFQDVLRFRDIPGLSYMDGVADMLWTLGMAILALWFLYIWHRGHNAH